MRQITTEPNEKKAMRKWEPNAWETAPAEDKVILIHPTNYDPEYPKDHPDMSPPDSPQHRIGQLEGAILAALPYFENAVICLERYRAKLGHKAYSHESEDAKKVIANLKAIVKEKE